MTVFCVRSVSCEPLVGFTNNFAQMSNMIRGCAMLMFDQGQFKVNIMEEFNMDAIFRVSVSVKHICLFLPYFKQCISLSFT